MLKADTMDRLVCAKFLYQAGIEVLDRGDPFAAGLAILSFQDAAELVLRAVAAHEQAKVTETTQFATLIEAIDAASAHRVPNRSELFQINRMRVTFKHSALLPRVEDVRKSRSDLEAFFGAITPLFFGVRFEDVSMVGLIRHVRAANWLRKAEEQLTKVELAEAVLSAAKGLAVFLKSREAQRRGFNLASNLSSSEPRSTRGEPGIPRGIHELAHNVEEQFEKVWERLDLLSSGINAVDYDRFLDLSPEVRISAGGTFLPLCTRSTDELGYEDALFCVNFAIQTVLKTQGQYQAARHVYRERRHFRVTSSTSVIVRPLKDETDHEEIFLAEVGQVLVGAPPIYDQREAGYVAILQDNQYAYIRADAVSEVAQLTGVNEAEVMPGA